jgi:hypothetical protein
MLIILKNEINLMKYTHSLNINFFLKKKFWGFLI